MVLLLEKRQVCESAALLTTTCFVGLISLLVINPIAAFSIGNSNFEPGSNMYKLLF